MPVIQLPRDTRWGELGKGLGDALTNVIEGYQDKQASEGVAAILGDPNIADTKKYAAAVKQFGALGGTKYKEAIATQVLQATIAQKQAEALKDTAAATAGAGREKLIRDLLGLPAPATTGAAPTSGATTGAGAPAPGNAIADVLGGGPATAPAAPAVLGAGPYIAPGAVASGIGVSRPGASPAQQEAAVISRGVPTPTPSMPAPLDPRAAGAETGAAYGAPAPAPASSPITVPPPNTSMMPSAAPAPALTPGPTAQANATVGALGGTPGPAAAPGPTSLVGPNAQLVAEIDRRAQMGGVTFTPAERLDLIRGVVNHIFSSDKGAGLSEYMAPVDRAIKLKQEGLKFPVELGTAQSGAATAAAGAKTAEAKAQVDLQRAQQEQRNLQAASPYVAGNAEAGARKLIAEADRSQQLTAQGVPYDLPQDQLAAAFPSLTTEQRQTLGVVAKTEGAAKFAQTLDKFVATNTEASRKQVPQFVTDVAAILPAIHTYQNNMATLETHPNMNGGPISGVVAPLIAKWGLDFFGLAQVPPETLNQLAQSEQLTLQTVEGHRGMGGAFLVPLVSATMPSAAKVKIFNAIETNVKAEDYLAKLGSYRTAYQAAGMDTAQVDEAIAAAQKLHDRTSTLWWTGSTAGQNSRVFYKRPTDKVGVEIDPNTWQPVPGGAREYEAQSTINVGNNRSLTGAEINQLAREAGQVPEEVLARLKAQAGGAQ